MSSIQLPSELTDSIIDHLRADCFSLQVCSTVCKTWLPRSRYHLFENVDVCLQHSNHIRFFELLDSPSATLVPYVRNLILRDERGDKWIAKALLRLRVLTAVKSLGVEQVQFDNMQTKTIPTLFASFGELESLRMYQVSFGSLTHMMDALSACPRLERLSLDIVEWESPPVLPGSDGQRAPSRLRSLALGGGCDKDAVAEWLHSCRPIPSIEELHLNLIHRAPTQAMCDFLSTVGPSLKLFGFGFAAGSGDVGVIERAFCVYVDFAAFNQLQIIKFEAPPLYALFQPFLWLGWIRKVLSQIRSRHLQNVEFDLAINDPKELDILDWDWMSNEFQKPAFLALRMVRFLVRGRFDSRAVKAAIREKLPDCDTRGILFVEFPVFEVCRRSL